VSSVENILTRSSGRIANTRIGLKIIAARKGKNLSIDPAWIPLQNYLECEESRNFKEESITQKSLLLRYPQEGR
jgi:hypothetical protein